jgi:hypothetical protein
MRSMRLLGAAAVLSILPTIAESQQRNFPSLRVADPTERADGTMSAAARAAITRGPLPMSAADVAQKAAANRAHAEAVRSGAALRRAPRSELEDTIGPEPHIARLKQFTGQQNPNSTPPDTTGAIGPTRYVQLVNTHAAIYNRNTGGVIGSGTLNQLADIAPTVSSFDPQII